jgi:aminoglycoside 3-N-acetyltransferase
VSIVDVEKERLISDLKEMGLNQGDHVSIASALSKVGNIIGGPEAFIDAAIEVIGSEGTLMVNTHNRFFHISQIKAANNYTPFDSLSTPCWTGLVSETLRKNPQAIRSRHPTNSVAAMGRKAGYLTEGHGPHSRPYQPYSRLAELGGKSLFIGLGDNLVALRHEAQYIAGLFDVVPIEMCINYIDEDGKTRLFSGADVYACTRALHRLVPLMRDGGALKEGMVGNAPSILVSTKEALDLMAELLRNDPSLSLCNNITCIWCRELERRMNLYKNIKNPMPFQENIFWIQLLGLVNRHRLRGSPVAIRTIRMIRIAYKWIYK